MSQRAETGAPTRTAKATEFGIPIRNVWHMLLYTWGDLRWLRRWSGEIDAAPSMNGLLASVLAKLVSQRIRIGLGREYVDVSRQIPGIRGQVDFDRSLRNRTFDRGEAFCSYQSFEVDAPRNQIIRSMLARLISSGDFGTDRNRTNELRHRLRLLVRTMEGVQLVPLSLASIRTLQLGRNDADYSLMLSICAYLLERMLLTEQAGRSPSSSLDRTQLTLHSIFEKFVAAFYRHHLTGWDLRTQSRLEWPATPSNSRLPAMYPDLTMRPPNDAPPIILDTKFTARSLSGGKYGKATYDSGHLYQLYAYLRTQEDVSEGHARARGILLYPAIKEMVSDQYVLQGHTLAIETVDLAADWLDVEARLLAVVA